MALQLPPKTWFVNAAASADAHTTRSSLCSARFFSQLLAGKYSSVRDDGRNINTSIDWGRLEVARCWHELEKRKVEWSNSDTRRLELDEELVRAHRFCRRRRGEEMLLHTHVSHISRRTPFTDFFESALWRLACGMCTHGPSKCRESQVVVVEVAVRRTQAKHVSV